MSLDEQHVALPKLYGAPAYARPRVPVEETPRPFDPDELPIAAARTAEEQQFAESLPGRAFVAGGNQRDAQSGSPHEGDLKGRPFLLRSIAGRFFGGDS